MPRPIKICLTEDIPLDGGRLRRGMFGNAFFRITSKLWLVEFKIPDPHFVNRFSLIYAEVGDSMCRRLYEKT
jgi:hypothetical protein